MSIITGARYKVLLCFWLMVGGGNDRRGAETPGAREEKPLQARGEAGVCVWRHHRWLGGGVVGGGGC